MAESATLQELLRAWLQVGDELGRARVAEARALQKWSHQLKTVGVGEAEGRGRAELLEAMARMKAAAEAEGTARERFRQALEALLPVAPFPRGGPRA